MVGVLPSENYAGASYETLTVVSWISYMKRDSSLRDAKLQFYVYVWTSFTGNSFGFLVVL